MKKLFLTMASLVMLASMTFAQDETPMLPSQHGLTDHQPAWGSSQEFNLAVGWNWWSTYLNGSTFTDLETVLEDDATQIKSSDPFVSYINGTWQGTLSGTIQNDQMYSILMTSAKDISLRGSRADVANVEISGGNSWNWVGYPVGTPMSINYALQNYENPVDGDMFKGIDPFSVYDETNNVWVGTLNLLQPGAGYKMLSQKESYSFHYPTDPDPSVTRYMISQDATSTEWQAVMASTPTNMNMIAVVNLNDKELRSENVEIGVFNGEICRGAVHPMYVDFLDQYVVFLTMYGEENEPFSFRLLDNETGDIYESNEASVSYKADNIIGALRSPFELNFNTKNMVANHLHLFPNPVHHGEMVNMILPEGSVTVEVVNMLGSTVKSMRMTGSELSADMAPGIYTVKVIDAEGKVYVDKLVVK